MFLAAKTVACTDYVLGYYLSIVKTILILLQIAAPITFLLSLAISFIRMIAVGENQKLTKGIFKKIIAVIIFFLLPFIVQLVLNLVTIDDLDNSVQYTLGSCWENAETLKNSIDQTEDKGINSGNNNSSLTPNTSTLEDKDSDDSSNSSQKPTKLIFIGDSRTEGMRNAVNSNDIWSCKSSMGLDWMKSTGVPNIENQITKESGIIILMGVNDLGNVNNYASYINSKVSGWKGKGASIYFISVLPTKGSRESLNSQIDSFNQTIQKKLSNSIKYIDANSYLKSDGFDSSDGLHYTVNTYKKIYTYILNHL